MSENLAPGLQRAYDLALEFHPKDTPCPTCGKKIRSVSIKGDRVVFKPCGCTFAEVRATQNMTINPGLERR